MTVKEMIKFYRIELAASGDKLILRNTAAANGKLDEIAAAKPAIMAELARREREKKYPAIIKYTVFSEAASGIYNGFYGDTAVSQIIEDYIGSRKHLRTFSADFIRDIGRLSYRPEIRDQLMDYYTPYPVSDSWRDEYKQLIIARIANKTAPGCCAVPYEAAKSIIISLYIDYLREHLPQKINDLAGRAAYMERVKLHKTAMEAKKAAKAYNDLHNEGGEGYVPPMYTEASYEYAKAELDELKKTLEEL